VRVILATPCIHALAASGRTEVCRPAPASHSGHSDVVVCHTADGVSYDRFVAKAGTVIDAGPLGMQGRNGIFTQDALVSTRYRSRPDRFC
jgi:hypothetical protein